MRIGALYQGQGKCLFRVFAPQAENVALEFPIRAGSSRPMEKRPQGYWEATVDDVTPGELYLYRPGKGTARPDPASHHQPQGVHGPSQIWDHAAFKWTDQTWKGIPLDECILYEIHPGAFTAEGTLDAIITKLPHLNDLGVNAVEIMPVNQFPGARNWGYDGTYPFAVQNSYGGPDSLKRLVDACHANGIAVILDVVYNHLGPEGNYFSEFGPYFTSHYATPWGSAVNFDQAHSDQVRDFFIENALYWLREYHLDGLRLDDFQHCVDGMLRGEESGYKQDYGSPDQFTQANREGFVYAGEFCPSRGRRFGASSALRPPGQFIVFIQNHDQVGNRPLGERFNHVVGFEAYKLAAGAMFMSPYIPLLFMGEEYLETNPFPFFCDFGEPDLAKAVREGRQREFAYLHTGADVPDPGSVETFLLSKLDWDRKDTGRHRKVFDYYRELIALRKTLPSLRRLNREGMEMSSQGLAFTLLRRSQGTGDIETGETLAFLNFGTDSARRSVPVREGEWQLLIDSTDRRWDGPGSTAPKIVHAGESLELPSHGFLLYRRRS